LFSPAPARLRPEKPPAPLSGYLISRRNSASSSLSAYSSQAAAGSPPLRKSRNKCGGAPLSFRLAVCWPPPAGVPYLLSGFVLARRCSDRPCRDRRSLSPCRPWWGGTIPVSVFSPRSAPAAPQPRSPSPASLWGWSPRTPSSARARVQHRSRPDTSALPGGHHRPADASTPGVLHAPEEVSPQPSWPADIRG
jgi:hypothetical protein